MAERTSLGLKFCLLANNNGAIFGAIRSSEEVLRIERRVDVLGMVTGMTRVFSEARSRWNDVESAEETIPNGVDEGGRGEVA